MKRNSSRRKRNLIIVGGLLLATVVLSSAFLVGSGAVFTASSANPANIFTAGTMKNINSKPGAAILTAGNMKPGSSANGSVTISNTGTLAGDFSIYAQKSSSANGANGGDLYDVLDLTITEGAASVWTGHLKDFNASTLPLALETFDAAEAHTYTFTVSFPNGGTPAGNTTGDNAYQGSATTVEFDWVAVQS